MPDDDPIEPPTKVDRGQKIEPATGHAGFDRYRSLGDPHLTIFVAKDVVPPFRFKSGGWELLQSSIEVGVNRIVLTATRHFRSTDSGHQSRAKSSDRRVFGLNNPHLFTLWFPRATWDQPVPTDGIVSHRIFGLAQKLSLVVDEIVAG